jgi:two-component system cell cycle sensor histidine kinase/response regulator CckA
MACGGTGPAKASPSGPRIPREDGGDAGARFRAAFELAGIGMAMFDAGGLVIESNVAFRTILGYTEEELGRMCWANFTHPEDLARQAKLASSLAAGEIGCYSLEARYLRGDGRVIWANVKVTPLPAGFTLAVFEDITERKEAEEALRESERRFREIVDSAPVMLWMAGPNKMRTYANRALLDFTGSDLDQQLGNAWVHMLHPEDVTRCCATYASAFDARVGFRVEYRLRRADGEYGYVLEVGVPQFREDGSFAGYLGSSFDITDLRSGPQQISAARLSSAAIGAAAAPPQPVDMTRVIEEAVALLNFPASRKIALKLNLGRNLPTVRADAAEMRQVVVNLLANASEAIPESGGIISVSAARVHLRAGSVAGGAIRLREGDYVRLEISDTGSGMPNEVQARVFDPFFTTKPEGTGLGLTVVREIVHRRGGAIHLVSAPGLGSTFEILMPCSEETAIESHAVPAAALLETAQPAATILLIEYDDVLRAAVAKTFRRRNFSVLETADGYAALSAFRAHKDEISVVLLDAGLPGISAHEFLAEARRLRPDLKIVMTSASPREIVTAQFSGRPFAKFLQKPYRLSELMRKVRQVAGR